MPQPILFHAVGNPRLPTASSSAILVVSVLWLVCACVLPLYQLRQARRQAHQDLLHILTADKPDTGGVIAVFDRSNQHLDAAASGTCLVLAFTGILLANQLLKLNRRYHALARDLSTPNRPPGDVD